MLPTAEIVSKTTGNSSSKVTIMQERKRQIIKLTIMIVVTLSFFVAELTGGFITESLALVGDSYHMISDVMALLIGLSCLIVSTRSSKNNTFGWARAEILGALINSVFLAALCFSILLEALERLVSPQKVKEPLMLLLIGVVGLAVNLLGLLLFCNEAHLHSHAPSARADCQQEREKEFASFDHSPHAPSEPEKEKDEKEENCKYGEGLGEKGVAITISNSELAKVVKGSASGTQMNIRGIFLHLMGDALGSLVVIVSALVFMMCDGSWVLWVDPVLSIVMVLIILSTTYPLFKQSSLILMQHVPYNISVAELHRKLSSEIEGIFGIHELHVWQLVGRKGIASLHIKCRNAHEYELLSVKVKQLLHKEGIHSTTIQPEFFQPLEDSKDHRELQECTMRCHNDCQQHWCCYKKQHE